MRSPARWRTNIALWSTPALYSRSTRDLAMRTDIVWQIERTLAEAAIRPVLFYPVGARLPRTLGQGTDHRDHSIYNNWRMEDVWLK